MRWPFEGVVGSWDLLTAHDKRGIFESFIPFILFHYYYRRATQNHRSSFIMNLPFFILFYIFCQDRDDMQIYYIRVILTIKVLIDLIQCYFRDLEKPD